MHSPLAAPLNLPLVHELQPKMLLWLEWVKDAEEGLTDPDPAPPPNQIHGLLEISSHTLLWGWRKTTGLKNVILAQDMRQ